MGNGRLVELDDDLRVYASSATDARYMYGEIFRSRCYDVAGLPDRPFIVDVGANIGLSVLFATRRHPTAEVLAFEPMPRSASLLRRNLALHKLDGSVTVHEVALGGRSESGVPFTYFPVTPGNSTRHLNTRAAGKARLAETLPDRVIERIYRGREVAVTVRRLSEFLPAGRPVDLLKIDVEGAEVDVLRGIDESHWPLIRRMVLEIHDVNGRIEAAREILRSHGLEPALRSAEEADSPAPLLYATRADLPG